MGLLSSSRTTQTSNYYTHPESTVGDIGLTGAHAVALADVVGGQAVHAQALQLSTMQELFQQVGSAWHGLIGGAGDLVQTAAAVSDREAAAGERALSAMAGAGTEILGAAERAGLSAAQLQAGAGAEILSAAERAGATSAQLQAQAGAEVLGVSERAGTTILDTIGAFVYELMGAGERQAVRAADEAAFVRAGAADLHGAVLADADAARAQAVAHSNRLIEAGETSARIAIQAGQGVPVQAPAMQAAPFVLAGVVVVVAVVYMGRK